MRLKFDFRSWLYSPEVSPFGFGLLARTSDYYSWVNLIIWIKGLQRVEGILEANAQYVEDEWQKVTEIFVLSSIV